MLIFHPTKETDVGPANSEGSSDQNQEICRSVISDNFAQGKIRIVPM
jgi:hypothetical protein